MKKLIVILLVFVCTITTVFAAEVNVIKDDNLRDALTQLGVDTNKDGKITAKVENVAMTSASSSAIKISWDETEASGYEVYRSTNNKADGFPSAFVV